MGRGFVDDFWNQIPSAYKTKNILSFVWNIIVVCSDMKQFSFGTQ